MYRRASKEFTFQASKNNVPVNITGASIVFTAKKSRAVEAIVIQKTVGLGITVTDAANGIFKVKLNPADTEPLQRTTVLVWDVQITDVLGDIIIPLSGTLRVDLDVRGVGFEGWEQA